MHIDTTAIAKTEVVRVCSSGERISIIAEIGRPYQTSEGFWRTPLALHGLDGRLSDIYGEDSLQSLALAVRMIRLRLTDVIERGDQLLDTEGGEFSLHAHFGSTHE